MSTATDFPDWKHLLIMGLLYLAGSLLAALPLGLLVLLDAVAQADGDFQLALASAGDFGGSPWVSHLAPFMSAFPLLLCIYYGWTRLGKPAWKSGLTNVPLPAAILAVVGTLLIGNGTTMVAEYLPGYEAFARAMEEMLVPGIGMAIAIILCAPIFEEALLRGIVLRGYLRKASPARSILVSGLCFGLLHVIPIHVFFASIIGFALGYVYYRTRSLGLVILIHLLNNGASYWAAQAGAPATSEELLGTGMAGVLVLAAGLSGTGVGLLYLLGDKYPLVPPPEEAYRKSGGNSVGETAERPARQTD